MTENVDDIGEGVVDWGAFEKQEDYDPKHQVDEAIGTLSSVIGQCESSAKLSQITSVNNKALAASYHTPTSPQDIETQLRAWEKSDPSVKKFANEILVGGVQVLIREGMPLIFIEAWSYTIVNAMTGNQAVPAQYKKLTKDQQTAFNTLMGYSDFKGKLLSNAFTLAEITMLAKGFSEGDSSLRNIHDKALMTAFYEALEKGQKPTEAAQDAYLKVDFSTVSKGMIELIQGLSGYNPAQFTPHIPTSAKDIENQLKAWEEHDPSVTKFANEILSGGIQVLVGEGVSLVFIEAWVYTVINAMTGNLTIPVEYQGLTQSQKNAFDILTGYSDFMSKLKANSFSVAEVSDIAGDFAKGDSSLRNAQDKALMTAFHTNLQAGQDLKTAAQNAYSVVKASTVTNGMNALVQGLSGYSPSDFTPHTPETIQDLEAELKSWEAADSKVKAFADAVYSKIQTLEGAKLGLTSIEAWVYAALSNITKDSTYYNDFQGLSKQEKSDFSTLSGMSDFSSKLAQSAFDTTTVTAVAKSFSDGAISLKNSNDHSLMQDFYTNLQAGQDLKTAAQNAYAKVDYKGVSQTMNLLVEGLSGYSLFPSSPKQLADAIVDNIGVNKANLITNLKVMMGGIESTVSQDEKNYLKGFQPFIDQGQIVKDKEGEYSFDPHVLLPSVTNSITMLVGIDKKSFAESMAASLVSYLKGVASQIDPIQKFPYDKDLFKAKIVALDAADTQLLINELYLKLDMGAAPVLSQITTCTFPVEKSSPFEPKQAPNIGMDMMDPYVQINYSKEISIFPDQPLKLEPSIKSSEAVPFSPWWQILGNAQAYNELIQVTDEGTAPTANPPTLPMDVVQALYQRNPNLFPTFGGSIEVQTPSTPEIFNANILLKDGTLTVGNYVGPVMSEIIGNPQPTASQGTYYVGSTGMGILFSNPELYFLGSDANWQGHTLSFSPGHEVLVELYGESSPFYTNGSLTPQGTMTPTGQHSVVYQQCSSDGSSVTTPVVKNSPYMPVFTHGTAPKISIDTPDATITGISTFHHASGGWQQVGSPIATGKTPEGQLFRLEVKTSVGKEYFTVYTDQPQSFTLASSAIKKIVPDDTTFSTKSNDAAQFIHYSDAAKLATKQGDPLPEVDKMNWFAATMRVANSAGAPNELVGAVGTGDLVTVVAKLPAVTVAGIADPLQENFGLPLDKGASFVPISGDVKTAGMESGQSTSQTAYQFYQSSFPGADGNVYMGQLPNNYHTLESAPQEADYASGKLPYYQTLNGVQRIVPVAPQKNSDGTYSVVLSYTDSDHYGLYNAKTQSPTVVTDWMDQASSSQLNGMVSALTDPNLEPNPVVSDQDYSIAQEVETNANTALLAQKLLNLSTSGKLTLSAQQQTQLKQVVATFTTVAEQTMGVVLGSYSWDPKHNMLVSVYGNLMPSGASGDFYNDIGEDIQFTNGYFIHAAATIRQLDPKYFQTPDASTPYVWDTPDPQNIPNQAQYRARIVDALINEVEPNPENAVAAKMFPAGRQIDNDTHMFKSHGWNQPTLDGQDLESTAEAINFCQASAVWNHLQGEASTNQAVANTYALDSAYHLNHAIEGVRAAQTFRCPENKTSMYQDPLASDEMKQYGEAITFSNIAFVRKITSDTYWGPGPKGDILTPLGSACMQGINMLAQSLDAPTSEKLIKTLFSDVYFDSNKDPRTQPDWSQITQSKIFKNASWEDPKTRWGIADIIPTVLPYIARYSPNLALGILDWYREANAKDPTIYVWHLSGNGATSANYILEAENFNQQTEGWVDPVSSADKVQITNYLEQMQSETQAFHILQEQVKA